jgi:hypothetical protein
LTLQAAIDAESNALVVIGDRPALDAFAASLAAPSSQIEIRGPEGREALSPVHSVEICDGALATISRDGRAVVISGDAKGRMRLAEVIVGFLAHNDIDKAGMHFHVDAGDATGALAPGSLGLVVAGPNPDS